jgi:hypothetical protein
MHTLSNLTNHALPVCGQKLRIDTEKTARRKFQNCAEKKIKLHGENFKTPCSFFSYSAESFFYTFYLCLYFVFLYKSMEDAALARSLMKILGSVRIL